MKLKFKRFENNNETIECEIDGPFINNNNDIEFGLDEKKIVITGKNGSGKTQFISGILDSINAFNNDHNNNNKIFIGYLTHNLAFNFDKRRVSNVHELHIDDTLIELFNKLLNADIDKDILVNSFLIHNGKIGTPLEVFKPFNLLTFFIKFNIKYNNRSPVEDLNEELKSLGISENSITYENSSNKIILQKIPTSGELLFLNFLVVKWIHTKVKKFEILLFDEPDRHFEPKIVEKFFKILNDEFKDTRIFLTTHRPDTILLSQKDPISFKLCKLKQNVDDKHILEKYSGQTTEVSYRFFVLSTIFDLTYNLREIMNIKVRVYVESNDDYTFYKSLYHYLLDYCNSLRNSSEKDKDFDKGKQIFFNQFPILSRRYQLYFCTSASNNEGGNGGIDKAEYNQNRDLTQRELDLKDIKSFWDGDFFKSYGIIDRDGDRFQNVKKYSSNFQILKRYNIENYIVDPMFLDTNTKFSDCNLQNQFIKFKNIIKNNKRYNKNEKNSILIDFFKIFMKNILLQTKNNSKDKGLNDFVENYIYNEIKIIDIIISDDKYNLNFDKKNLNQIKDKLQEFINTKNIDNKLIDILVKETRNQKYFKIENDGFNFECEEFDYPLFFLKIDGKKLMNYFSGNGNNKEKFRDLITNIDFTRKWISIDFVEIFSNINNELRQYPIIYLVKNELEILKSDKLTKDEALTIIRKAGFSEKKFELCMNNCTELNEMIE